MNRFLLAFLITATAAFADQGFPGLKDIMSPEEYKEAGLNRLTPQQLGALEAVIARHYLNTVETTAAAEANQIATSSIAKQTSKSILQRFGLPDISFSQDWKEKAGLSGKVTGWVGGNSFKLDNGQIWEGQEPIPFELVDRQVEISPRPNGQFALVVEGKNTTIRVRRVK